MHRHDSLLKNNVRHAFPVVRDGDYVVQKAYLRIRRMNGITSTSLSKASRGPPSSFFHS